MLLVVTGAAPSGLPEASPEPLLPEACPPLRFRAGAETVRPRLMPDVRCPAASLQAWPLVSNTVTMKGGT